MALTVDRSAVLAGARLSIVVGAGAILLAQAVRSLTGVSISPFLYFVTLGGFCAGGRLSALRQPMTPLTHGGLAAIAAYVALLVVFTVIRVALGREVADPVYLVFNGLMAISAGMFGGYLAIRKVSRST